MTPEQRKKACEAIRLLTSHKTAATILHEAGFGPIGEALALAFQHGQASDLPWPVEGVPMILSCPVCNQRHIDEGEFATKLHHTHACQTCGLVWRPAIVSTFGVQFLPGFKNEVRP